MNSPQSSPRRHARTFLVLLALGAAGCTGPGGGQLSGTVRYKDEVLSSGPVTWTVLFVSSDGQTIPGLVGKDGQYNANNVPPGLVKIAVVGEPRVPPGLVAPGERPPKLDDSSLRLLKTLKPYRNPDRSGLTCTVRSGKQRHDIELPP
jgi:hypothetical protein